MEAANGPKYSVIGNCKRLDVSIGYEVSELVILLF